MERIVIFALAYKYKWTLKNPQRITLDNKYFNILYAKVSMNYATLVGLLKEVIKKMQTKDPTKRISAKKALADPWIQHNAPPRKVNPKFMQIWLIPM